MVTAQALKQHRLGVKLDSAMDQPYSLGLVVAYSPIELIIGPTSLDCGEHYMTEYLHGI